MQSALFITLVLKLIEIDDLNQNKYNANVIDCFIQKVNSYAIQLSSIGKLNIIIITNAFLIIKQNTFHTVSEKD